MTRNVRLSESLAARINEAERHLRARQRSVDAQGTKLGNRIHERLTSSALLGSAVGLGFLLGNRARAPGSGPSWLRIAVSSMPWVQTLFNTVEPSAATPVPSSSDFSD